MKTQPICGVYKITNKADGRCYVGLSVDIHKRWRAHLAAAGSAKQYEIHKAMAELGPTAFTFEIIELCSRSELSHREIHWVQEHRAYLDGYNMNPGGTAPVATADSKRKTSLALVGKPKAPEHVAKVSAALKGRKPSDEQRKLFSEAAKARWSDPEKRAALMQSRSRKRVCSAETKAKLSAALTAHTHQPAVRAQRTAQLAAVSNEVKVASIRRYWATKEWTLP